MLVSEDKRASAHALELRLLDMAAIPKPRTALDAQGSLDPMLVVTQCGFARCQPAIIDMELFHELQGLAQPGDLRPQLKIVLQETVIFPAGLHGDSVRKEARADDSCVLGQFDILEGQAIKHVERVFVTSTV